MCLATAFRKNQEPGSIICDNISKIIVDDNTVILCDILGSEVAVEGKIAMVDLAKSIVVINPLEE